MEAEDQVLSSGIKMTVSEGKVAPRSRPDVTYGLTQDWKRAVVICM